MGKREEGGTLSQSCSGREAQAEDAAATTEVLAIMPPTLIPDGSGTSLPLELGWGRNSASLQLVAESDSAGKEPLSFLHCRLPECPGAPWLVL